MRSGSIANLRGRRAYDPLGRLWQVSGGPSGTRRFLYDGDALVAEYDQWGNMLKRYVHGQGADTPQVWFEGAGTDAGSRRYLFTNHQGSVTAIADGWGNTIAINRYDEYGIPGANNTGRFQYTGQAWLEDLGMYHYKARIYSPTLGRFLQTDPIGYEDQINLYAYVANDPVNKVDPDGKEAYCITSGGTCTDPDGITVEKVVNFVTVALVAIDIIDGPIPDVGAAALAGRASARTEAGVVASGSARTTAKVNPDGKTFTDATGRVRTPTAGGPGAGRRISPGTRAAEREAAGGRCIYCGNKTDKPQGDHIAPRNPRGGGERGNNSPENTGNACPTCNQSKSNWDPIEWIKRTFGFMLYGKENKSTVSGERKRLAWYGGRKDMG